MKRFGIGIALGALLCASAAAEWVDMRQLRVAAIEVSLPPQGRERGRRDAP